MNQMPLLLSPENANDLVSTIENAFGKGDDVSRRSIESTLRFMQTGGMCPCGHVHAVAACMSVCITLFVLLDPGLTKSTSQAPNQISVSKDASFSYRTVCCIPPGLLLVIKGRSGLHNRKRFGQRRRYFSTFNRICVAFHTEGRYVSRCTIAHACMHVCA